MGIEPFHHRKVTWKLRTLNRQGSSRIDGWLFINHCTCDISPAPQPLSPKTLFDRMLLRSQESQLIHMETNTRGASPSRGETRRFVLLVAASQMCLLLTSHSHIAHFCLLIAGPLFETMEGPQSEAMPLNTSWNVWKPARGWPLVSQYFLLPGVAFELVFIICFVFPVLENRARRAGKKC